MASDLKIILIIVATLTLMFATSLLLDLQMVQQQIVRIVIIYIAILVQLVIGFAMVKANLKQ